MPYWPPDTPPPPNGVEQMPAAAQGPAPVPYSGPGWALAPDMLAPAPDVPMGLAPGAGVLDGVTGANHVTEAPLAAPGVNPYEAGAPQAIFVGGDGDPGGRDIVAGSVAGSVAAAHAWLGELQADTYGQGSTIGDLMTMPPSHLDPAASSPGTTAPSGGFYDPPRDYGGGQ